MTQATSFPSPEPPSVALYSHATKSAPRKYIDILIHAIVRHTGSVQPPEK
ncbi:hypothetical protein DBB_42780 [Desulfoluna spongiiphila]|nr:hypothetical protein DBB_42780 [Desulfoluna spongiiphila]